MPDATKLPHCLDERTKTCRVIIETSKGKRSKYKYDPKARLFEVHSVLPDGLSFPLDFGFVPSTLCDDGDPIDVMVLSDEPSAVGSIVKVRLIGVIEAEQREEGGKPVRNDRLVGVIAMSHLYARVKNIHDLEPDFIRNLEDFWSVKDDHEGKAFSVIDVRKPAQAIRLIHEASKAARAAKERSGR